MKRKPHINISFDKGDAQAKLNAAKGSVENNFDENLWTFHCINGEIIRINFNTLLSFKESYSTWYEALSFDLITVSKLMWIESCTVAISAYQSTFSGIEYLWAALARNNQHQLTQNNLESVIAFYLLYSYQNGTEVKRLNLYSAVRFQSLFKLDDWIYTFRLFNIKNIIVGVTFHLVTKTLKTVIPALTNDELTYADWRAGGSFNRLTLDFGQYYIEHCMLFFEEHIALATAISSTYNAVEGFALELQRDKSKVLLWTTYLLTGKSTKEITSFVNRYGAQTSETTIAELRILVTLHFQKIYCSETFLSKCLQESTIVQICDYLKLNQKQENIDRLRVIIWTWLKHQDEAETISLLTNTAPPISFTSFSEILNALYEAHKNMQFNIPQQRDYERFGLTEKNSYDSNNKFPRQLVRLVEQAGLTSLVALNGWRRSEFGFSISNVKGFDNEDLLDQYAFPIRYQVHWFVFKTNGRIPLSREITFHANILIHRMRSLTNASSDSPCLFRANSVRKRVDDSSVPVQNGVIGLWVHYVQNYGPFKNIRDKAIWDRIADKIATKSALSKTDLNEYARLKALRSAYEWEKMIFSHNLQDAYRICTDQLARVAFFFTDATDLEKKDWLLRYKSKSLSENFTKLIDLHVSEETKAWIQTLSEQDCKLASVVRVVSEEILEGCLYPTPHAFRHIWVEGVYRSNDGDVGWIVRSQFKHISRSEWLAYVRNKDHRAIHQVAKENVISSLVHNYLENAGEGYSGYLHTWLRRLSKSTLVMTPEEKIQFAEKIATVEILDIKANPWGYCLLKRRTQSKAKCAVSAVPQRHNASPDLCLGCIHNLMQSEHIDWLLLHIASHVETLKNPIVPPIFKSASYELVNLAAKHITTLDPHHGVVPELHQALESYVLGNLKT
ncbi:hypothetical protein [Cellvibrio sp. PSBB023]|uniref:hypothetical protein n=1 Tax=Cellvibrio sp. PSBB023 TaxID=1945512 RepID=UPI00098F8C9B|nr:hypothetical protein [Cellvibrio sp. PSBB023]AQT61473.1 hypothetical protein B0D95_16180 [Cellvibrio sp. PSBB023]